MDDTQLEQLRRTAAASGDYRDMLAYRNALKRTGRKRGELDLPLARILGAKWQVVSTDRNESYGAVRQLLAELCSDDGGLQPFFLRDARPLTFKETIQARMEQFDQSGGKDWSLWTTWLDSCTGIVWEAGGRRFKIVPMHPDLLIAQPSNDEYLPADFAATPGSPLTVDLRYNRELTFDEVVSHPGWLAAVENDTTLLHRYATTAFARMGGGPGMTFHTALRPRLPDCLLPLSINSPDDGSSCIGTMMNLSGPFARICPP